MATVTKPIALDESLNTTEATPRNIADVLAEELSGIASALTPAQLASLADVTISSPSDGQTLKYDSVTQKWVNANDAGGHTIENPSGTDMTPRTNLAFVDAHITDNALDNKTEVEIAKEVTEAAFDALSPQGTEYDGVYLMEVDDATPLTADMVGYDGGTVKGALDVKTYTVTQHDHSSDALSGVTVTVQKCNVRSIGNLVIAGINFYLSSSVTLTAWTGVTLMDIADWGFPPVAWLDDYAPVFDPSGNVVGRLTIGANGTTGELSLYAVSEQKTLPANKYLYGQVVHIFE